MSATAKATVKEGWLRVKRDGIVPIKWDPLGLQKKPFWAVLSSSGDGILHLALYHAAADMARGLPSVHKYTILADLVGKAPNGFTLREPGAVRKLGMAAVDTFTSEDDSEGWYAALSTVKVESDNLGQSSGAHVGNLVDTVLPRLPGGRLLHGAIDGLTSKAVGAARPSSDPVNETTCRRHRDFVTMLFVRMDPVGLEAIILADAKLTTVLGDEVLGRAAALQELTRVQRQFNMTEVGEPVCTEVMAGDEAWTECAVTGTHMALQFELRMRLSLKWSRSQVSEVKWAAQGEDMEQKIPLLKQMQEQFREKTRELLDSPLPYEISDTDQEKSIMQRFSMDKVLGAGAFGTVKLAHNKVDGAVRAIKAIPKHLQPREDLESEIALMRAAKTAMSDKPYIIELFETFEGPNDYYLVMEVVSGGEVFDRIEKQGYFSEAEALSVMRQLMDAMRLLHNYGIVHRDLKPQNILYASNEPNAPIKIADFGLGAFWKDMFELHAGCGTPCYMAPELILSGEACMFDPYGMPMRVWRTYGPSVDVWSCGVILYELCSGMLPFQPVWVQDDRLEEGGQWDVKAMYTDICEGSYCFPVDDWQHISDECIGLISWMLTVNPSTRPTAAAVLEHPWIVGEVVAKAVPLPHVASRVNESRAAFSARVFEPHSVAAARLQVQQAVTPATMPAKAGGVEVD